MTRFIHHCKTIYRYPLGIMCFLLAGRAMADGAIPTPENGNQLTQNGDFISWLKTFFGSEAGPLLIVIIGVIVFVYLGWTVFHSFRESVRTKDFGDFKANLWGALVVAVVVGVLLYFAQYILTAFLGK